MKNIFTKIFKSFPVLVVMSWILRVWQVVFIYLRGMFMNEADTDENTDEAMVSKLRIKGQHFARTLLTYADTKKAEKLLSVQVEIEFDQSYAVEVEALSLESTETEKLYEQSIEGLFDLEEQKHKTKPYVKAHTAEDEKPMRMHFSNWEVKDQGSFIVALLAGVIVLIIGSANVYSNIMAAGDPVFLESPWLAGFLAALLPCGSLACKFIPEFLPNDQARQHYIQLMFGLTALSLLTWTGLFASTFHGVAGGFSLEEIGESNSSGIALTAVQLLSELLVGATLFHVVTSIYSTYASEVYRANPEYIHITNVIAEQLNVHESLRTKRNEARARLVQIKKMRQAHLNEIVALYQDVRARFENPAA